MAVAQPDRIVADVMLRRPKTLAADVTVAEAREALEHASVQMLLLVDGSRFYGAVTTLPPDADPGEPAIGFVQESPPIVTEDMTVSAALERLDQRANGRLIVLDEDRLVGLVCLTKDGMGFCGCAAARLTGGEATDGSDGTRTRDLRRDRPAF